MAKSDPVSAGNLAKRDDIRTGRWKVIDVSFYVNTGGSKDRGKLETEVSVGEGWLRKSFVSALPLLDGMCALYRQ